MEMEPACVQMAEGGLFTGHTQLCLGMIYIEDRVMCLYSQFKSHSQTLSKTPRPQKTVRVLYRGSGNETKSVSVQFCKQGSILFFSQIGQLHVIRSASRKEV